MLFQLLVNGLIMGVLYALISTGFALVYNTTRIFHIYYAALIIVAPYCLYALSIVMQWNFYIALLVSLMVCVLLSLLGELLVYYPFRKHNRSENATLVASIGLMTIVINIAGAIWGTEVKFIQTELIKPYNLFGVSISYSQATQFIVSALLLVIFGIALFSSKFGLLLRAHRDDERLFETLGKSNRSFRIIVFSLSGLIAGIVGLLSTIDVGLEPYRGMPLFIISVTALIIGGMGRYESSVLGGLIIGILQVMVIGFISAEWQDAIVFLVLVVFLIIRDQGILGEKERTA